MGSLLQLLAQWDRAALEASHALRWQPLTALFVLASAPLIKGPCIVAVAAAADLRARRPPGAAVLATLSLTLAAGLSALVKELVDRVRPALADPSISALVATPDSPSFPSGHAMTAFAAAAAAGFHHPRLRLPLFALAALVAFSRIYLGVHYWLDVLAGTVLGIAIGLSLAWAAPRLVAAARG